MHSPDMLQAFVQVIHLALESITFLATLALVFTDFEIITHYTSPLRAFQRSSPRHWRAEGHHSMQEGVCSL
jgi:hypothetical protein